MKSGIYALFPLTASLIFLINAEFKKNKKQIYFLKPIASISVITAAVLSIYEFQVNNIYLYGIIIGLILSMCGDMMLMFPERNDLFRIGLIFFLMAHIAYIATFSILSSINSYDWISAIVFLAAGIIVLIYLYPGLGNMIFPVIFYIIIISLMMNRAISTIFSENFSNFQVILIVSGASLFYISDLILAVARFKKPFKYNRISLAFYYSGQFLIAITASYF